MIKETPIFKTSFLYNEQDEATKELRQLGLETIAENVNVLIEQKNIKQHPSGFEELLNNLNDQFRTKELMTQHGIKSIVHSEGRSVWDHSKMAIEEVSLLRISEELKKDLKLIMLYHDLGKTVVVNNQKNIDETQKKVKKGELYQSMIDHHKERLSDIEAGFIANGISGDKLKVFMMVVENHMNTSLIQQDAKKTVELFKKFGENETEIKKVVELLIMVLQLDADATHNVKLVDNQLIYSKDDKKFKLDFSDVWKKYEEGKTILQEEDENKKNQASNLVFESLVLGKSVSDYVREDLKVQPGPEMGKLVKSIKQIIEMNKKGLSVEEIKTLIDNSL